MINEDLLEERLKTEDVFPVKTERVRVKMQQNFEYRIHQLNYVIRDVYEGIARALFAGDLRQRCNEEQIEPDLTDHERARYIEVKAASHTRRIMLKDDQIKKYAELQTQDSPIRNPRIYFTLFRYGTRGIHEMFKGHEDKAIRYLAENTRFMVGIPFSAVHRIYLEGHKSRAGIATRSNGEGTPCTNLSTKFLDKLFEDPELSLCDLGLDPEHYAVRKTRTPDRFFMNRFSITPFPMVLMKDNDAHHTLWSERFREQYTEDIPF